MHGTRDRAQRVFLRAVPLNSAFDGFMKFICRKRWNLDSVALNPLRNSLVCRINEAIKTRLTNNYPPHTPSCEKCVVERHEQMGKLLVIDIFGVVENDEDSSVTESLNYLASYDTENISPVFQRRVRHGGSIK